MGIIRLIRTFLATNMAHTIYAIWQKKYGFETFKARKTYLDVSEFSKNRVHMELVYAAGCIRGTGETCIFDFTC